MIQFVLQSLLCGVGLAMDAFSVSMADGLENPEMKKSEMGCIAGTFAFFQWFMPMVGWICVHTIVLYFSFFQKLIPWIALLLLSHIGWKMIQDAGNAEVVSGKDTWKLDRKTLMMQGIATSIDALSVGFTIANYHLMEAFTASFIIAAVTFVICIAGLLLGRVFGLKLAGKANILGGVILIGIGIEIFVTNMMR